MCFGVADRAVDKCDDGWVGHSLVPRCYRMVLAMTTKSEARDYCRMQGAVLASAESAFYSNVTALLLDRAVTLLDFGKTGPLPSLTHSFIHSFIQSLTHLPAHLPLLSNFETLTRRNSGLRHV